jgi:AcrR family transcriptional regulator
MENIRSSAWTALPKLATKDRLMKSAKAKSRKAPVKKKQRTKAEQRAETLEKILDAAELLFSRHGLYGVALRDVTAEAGVHTSLMRYYFDDKLELFRAVFARRAGLSVERRLRAFDRYEKDVNGKPTVAGALHVLLDTDFDLYIEGGEGGRNYAAFVAQIASTPEAAQLFEEHFNPVILRFLGILRKALPDVPERSLFWGIHFLTGAVMHSYAHSGRIDRLSGGLCQSDDLASIREFLADFIAAGFVSLPKKASAK